MIRLPPCVEWRAIRGEMTPASSHFLTQGSASPASRAPMRLSASEEALAGRVAAFVEDRGAHGLAQQVRKAMEALRNVSRAAESYPSPLREQSLGGQHRDAQSLVASLTSETLFSMTLVLPTRAALMEALSVARLNAARMLRRVLEQSGSPAEDGSRLRTETEDAIAGCVRRIAVEELLRSIACGHRNVEEIRRRAAVLLLHLWHSGSPQPLSEAFRVLHATWEARRRCRIVFGTMLGASELYSLLEKGADARFLEFLTREDCTHEELEAFHEFLFGLSIEEIRALDREGDSELVTIHRLQEDESEPGRRRLRGLYQTGDMAEQFYRFFMKRQVLAANRAQMELPGPHKTAEQYVLEYVLQSQWEQIERCLPC